jgi:hypothetical protein
MISESDLYLGVKTIFAVESIEIPNSIFVFSLNISIFRIAATFLSGINDYIFNIPNQIQKSKHCPRADSLCSAAVAERLRRP